MFILTINGRELEGAYAVKNDFGEKVLYIFEEEDDAVRYALLLEEDGYPEIHIIEVDGETMIRTCEIYGHNYTIITENDIVVPPSYCYDNI